MTGDIAVFANGAGGTATLDGASPNLAEISFGDAGIYTIAPGTGGTLQLGNGSSPAVVAVAAGSQTISARWRWISALALETAAGSQLHAERSDLRQRQLAGGRRRGQGND